MTTKHEHLTASTTKGLGDKCSPSGSVVRTGRRCLNRKDVDMQDLSGRRTTSVTSPATAHRHTLTFMTASRLLAPHGWGIPNERGTEPLSTLAHDHIAGKRRPAGHELITNHTPNRIGTARAGTSRQQALCGI
jgi:hypothetical protein